MAKNLGFIARQKFSRRQLALFAAAFALLGAYFLIRSFAYNDPSAQVLYHTDGDLIQSSGDPKIYLIQDGQRHFVTLDDFTSGRYNLNNVKQASVGDEQYPVGSDASLPSGLLIRDQSSGDYYLTDQDSLGTLVSRPVSLTVLKALGYILASAVQVTNVPAGFGGVMTMTSAHPNGSKLSLGGQTYVVQGGQLRPASAEVLSTYDMSGTSSLPADAADKALPKGPALPYADGTLVQGSNPNNIYVIDDQNGATVKRLFRSNLVFTDLGYNTNDIHHVADAQLPTADGDPLPENTSAPVEISVNIKAGQDGTALAKQFQSWSGTTVLAAYKDWVALKLPLNQLNNLSSYSGVASLSGSAPSQPASNNCNDTGSGPAVPCPTISSFYASPSTINYDTSSTLNWGSDYASNCDISGIGNSLGVSGSHSTGNLITTTGYTLTCHSPYESSYDIPAATAGTAVTVGAPPSGGGGGGGGTNYSATCDAFNVTLRDNTNYTGNCLSTSSDQSDLSQISRPGGNWSDAAKSLDIKSGQGTTLSLYSATNYGGSCAQYTVDDSNLSTASLGPVFNQQAASLRADTPCPSSSSSGSGSSGGSCSGSNISNLSIPTISGTPAVGQTLATSNGTWCGQVNGFGYSWDRCSADQPVNHQCTYTGGSQSSYTVQSADGGYSLESIVTASGSGSSASAASAWTGLIPSTSGSSSGGGGGTGSSCSVTNGVVVFAGINYTGACMAIPANDATLGNTTIGNDNVSSIEVFGNYTADLYQNVNYSGNFSEFTEDHPSLVGFDIGNASTSSIQISSSVAAANSQTCPTNGTNGVYLYAATSYGGSKCDYFTGTSLRAENWKIGDNQAASVKIIGNYNVNLYSQDKMLGAVYNTTKSVPSLAGTAVAPGGAGGVSSLTAVGTGALPVNTTPPAISGITVVGKTLQTSDGAWSSGTNAAKQYIWQDCTGGGTQPVCHSISGATTNSYVLKSGDVNYNIRSEVLGTNISGTTVAYSPLTALVTATAPQPNPGAFVWPFAVKNTSQYERIDQGWDLQASAGAVVYAVAPGVINTYRSNCGLFGPDPPVEQLDKPFTGTDYSGWIYYGHVHIIPTLRGKHVVAGEAIATANMVNNQADSSGCVSGANAGAIEMGFSEPDSNQPIEPLPSQTMPWTQAGQNMRNLLIVAQPSVSTAGVASATQAAGLSITTDPIFDNSFKPNVLASTSPGLAAIGWTPAAVKGVVAVVGTGVDPVPGVDVRYSYGGSTPDCSLGEGNSDGSADKHDTTVARVIGQAGDGLSTPAGVAPGATIVAVRATGEDSQVPTTLGIACGIRWAADQGIKLINVSSAANIDQFSGSKPNFTDCTAPDAEAELAAICYAAARGATVVAAAGNYGASVSNYIPAAYSQVVTATSANEFNGLSPNNPSDAATAPKNSNSYEIYESEGFCGNGQDDYGQADANYNDGKTNFYAAPLCIWMGGTADQPAAYPHGTSFAAAFLSGILLKTNLNKASLNAGGAAGKLNGHDYGYEPHL